MVLGKKSFGGELLNLIDSREISTAPFQSSRLPNHGNNRLESFMNFKLKMKNK